MSTTTQTTKTLHFWLRDEVKPGEKRTPILPEHAKQLIDAGHTVTVEESVGRCVPNDEYRKVGCRLVPTGTWPEAPRDAIILGLKELADGTTPLHHRHIYFAHAYKEQSGWKDLLRRFVEGKGMNWDLEYLTDDYGRRVAAFGRSAGFIGMAVGIINWCHQQLHPEQEKLRTLKYHNNFKDLVVYVKDMLDEAVTKAGRMPKSLIVGALGRCGSGAIALAEAVGLQPIKWDMAETSGGGPFKEFMDVDILVNCIYLMDNIPPFLTMDFINQNDANRNLTVIVDVSCDPNNPWNPLPLYRNVTTFFDPNVRVISGPKPLDIIAIDHLPSLVPFESSKEFATMLIPHLIQCDQTNVWHRAKQLFQTKCAPIIKEM